MRTSKSVVSGMVPKRRFPKTMFKHFLVIGSNAQVSNFVTRLRYRLSVQFLSIKLGRNFHLMHGVSEGFVNDL